MRSPRRARLSRAGLGRRACSLVKLLLRLPHEELLQKLLGVFGAMQHHALGELAHQSADAVLLHVRLRLRPVT